MREEGEVVMIDDGGDDGGDDGDDVGWRNGIKIHAKSSVVKSIGGSDGSSKTKIN